MTKSPVPQAALAHHIAFLGKTGSGKSNGAKVIVEALLDAGERVCIVDPTGSWYGLRLNADGKPSRYPVVIFGGLHADVPIGPSHGAMVAEVIATSSTPAVIDTRLMTVGERTAFFTAFAETLLRKNRGPLHLVLDEAHVFAPQGRVQDPNSGKMLHAANNLVSLGRSIGLRIVMISQRPAKLHKDSLTQVETLVAMRVIAPQDRKAVEDWIGEWADKEQGKEIVASLPSLPTGDAWIWSPEIGFLSREHFPLATTYDSGKAPTGQDAGPELKPLDLDKLKDKLASIEEEVKANDPRALKAEVARLSREVARLEKVKAAPAPKPEIVHANEDDLQAAREEAQRVGIAIGLNLAEAAISKLRVDGDTKPVKRPASRAVFDPPPRAAEAPVVPVEGITGPQQRILNAIAWWQAFGIEHPTNEQAGFIAGYSPGSGNFNNLKGGLRSVGLIDYPAPGKISLTEAGNEKATAPGIDLTREAFHNAVRAKLKGPQLRLLDPVLAAYPESISSDAIADAAGYSPGSGNFNNLRGSLRSIGLIDYPSPGQVRAAEWLFP